MAKFELFFPRPQCSSSTPRALTPSKERSAKPQKTTHSTERATASQLALKSSAVSFQERACGPNAPRTACRPCCRYTCPPSRAWVRRGSRSFDTPICAGRSRARRGCSKAGRISNCAGAACRSPEPVLHSRRNGACAGIGGRDDLDAGAYRCSSQADRLDGEAHELLHVAQQCFNGELDGGWWLRFILLGKPTQNRWPPSASFASRGFELKSPFLALRRPAAQVKAPGDINPQGACSLRLRPEFYAAGGLDRSEDAAHPVLTFTGFQLKVTQGFC